MNLVLNQTAVALAAGTSAAVLLVAIGARKVAEVLPAGSRSPVTRFANSPRLFGWTVHLALGAMLCSCLLAALGLTSAAGGAAAGLAAAGLAWVAMAPVSEFDTPPEAFQLQRLRAAAISVLAFGACGALLTLAFWGGPAIASY